MVNTDQIHEIILTDELLSSYTLFGATNLDSLIGDFCHEHNIDIKKCKIDISFLLRQVIIRETQQRKQ